MVPARDILLTFDAFESRVLRAPDLVLSPSYWNHLVPEVTGRAIWVLFIERQLQAITSAKISSALCGVEGHALPTWCR